MKIEVTEKQIKAIEFAIPILTKKANDIEDDIQKEPSQEVKIIMKSMADMVLNAAKDLKSILENYE
jgi:uncharacterized protein YoxC